MPAAEDLPTAIDVPALWRLYGRHAEVMLRAGPVPRSWHADAGFVALSGLAHVDTNQAAVFGLGARDAAATVIGIVAEAGVPCLLGVSSTTTERVDDLLVPRDYQALPIREALFHASAPPPVSASGFAVRPVDDAVGLAGIHRLFADAHDYDEAEIEQLYGPPLLARTDLAGWVAWDGDTPVSTVFVTHVDRSLGVFDLMTAPAHRRRGAGRAVLTTALAASARGYGDIDTIVFWSTPDGRPLYASLGFREVDDIDIWVLGASEEDLAAVGAG